MSSGIDAWSPARSPAAMPRCDRTATGVRDDVGGWHQPASGPGGAAGRSHGWSGAAAKPPDAEPVDQESCFLSARPGRGEGGRGHNDDSLASHTPFLVAPQTIPSRIMNALANPAPPSSTPPGVGDRMWGRPPRVPFACGSLHPWLHSFAPSERDAGRMRA